MESEIEKVDFTVSLEIATWCFALALEMASSTVHPGPALLFHSPVVRRAHSGSERQAGASADRQRSELSVATRKSL